jgi:hypothetical protein
MNGEQPITNTMTGGVKTTQRLTLFKQAKALSDKINETLAINWPKGSADDWQEEIYRLTHIKVQKQIAEAQVIFDKWNEEKKKTVVKHNKIEAYNTFKTEAMKKEYTVEQAIQIIYPNNPEMYVSYAKTGATYDFWVSVNEKLKSIKPKNKDRGRMMLKKQRQFVADNTVFVQNTKMNGKDTFEKMLTRLDIVYLNKNINEQTNSSMKIISKCGHSPKETKDIRVIIAYGILSNAQKTDPNINMIRNNPLFPIDKQIPDGENLEDYIDYHNPIFGHNWGVMSFDVLVDGKQSMMQSIIDYAKNSLYDVAYVVISYQAFIVKIVKGNLINYNFTKYIEELKAFNPSTNQQYHKMTECSTTKDRLCIYQTYYYLYVDKTQIAKNEEKIKGALMNETAEIIECVKEGRLCDFLRIIAQRRNEIMFVRFFNDPACVGFKVLPNGEIKEIEDENEFVYMKIFLYDNEHVAPHIYKPKLNQKDVDALDKMTNTDDIIKYMNETINKSVTKRKTQFILKPIELKEQKDIIESVYAFDFETYCDERGTAHPFALTLSNGKTFYGANIEKTFADYLDSIKTEVDTSKTHQVGKISQICLYSFNGAMFDNIFIFDELLKRNKATKYIIQGTAIKYIKYHNIRIYDLHLYYAGSLKSVAEAFKLEITKGVYPYSFPKSSNLDYVGDVPDVKYWNSSEDRDTYIKENGNTFNLREYTLKYCLLDAQLTYEIAEKHLSECKGNINGRLYDVSMCPTGAGIALKLFTQSFLDEPLYESTPKQQLKERSAYKGGRTEVFKKAFYVNKDKHTLHYIDLNSSYPFAMTFEMPEKFVRCQTIKEQEIKMNDIIPHYLYKAKCEYIGNDKYFIPNILTRSDKNDIIATQNAPMGYHWGCELIEAIKNKCRVYISEINVYEGNKLFEEYSRYMYGERLKVKYTNQAKANFFKLCMNSLYGKFGQGLMINNKICSTSVEISRIVSNPECMVVGWELVGDKVLIKYNKKGEEHSSIGSLVRFSSYISAVARCNLSNMMRELGHEHIYYCDTDSIFTDAEIPEKYISQTELGKWKYETKDITEAKFLAPKTYYYKSNDHVCMKAKGQPQNELTTDIFDDVVNGDDVKIMNPSMFFRKLDSVDIRPQERTLQAVYNKRIWDENDSMPYKTYDDWYTAKYLL